MLDLDRRLRTLDRVATPDLWEEIERRAAEGPQERPWIPRARGMWRRRLGAVATVALVVTVAFVLVLLIAILPTRTPSALAVMKDAQEAFADVPPFRAELSRFVSAEQMIQMADELLDEFPKYRGEDWVYRHALWYGGAERWRREILADTLPFMRGGSGSFMVFDGNRTGVFKAFDVAGDDRHEDKTFYEEQGEDGQFSPLVDLSPEPTAGIGKLIQTRAGPGMAFDDYFTDRCQVLPNERVAGRVANHLACEDGYQELWLDAETGLILRHVTPESRQEIESIEYNPAFPERLFLFDPPPGAQHAPTLEATPIGVAQGDVVPLWSGPLLSGGEVSLEELRGKPVAIYLWASWCPPCIGDPLRNFEDVRLELGEKIHFVTVAVHDTRESVEEAVSDGDYRFLVVFDEGGEIAREWSVTGIPVFVVIDAEGHLLASYAGPLAHRDLRRVVDAVASGKPIPRVSPAP